MKTKMIKIFEDYEPFNCTQVDERYGDIMSVGEFADNCIDGGFIDYDGSLYLLRERKEDNEVVYYELPFSYEIENDNVFFFSADGSQVDVGSLVYACKELNIRKIIWYNK